MGKETPHDNARTSLVAAAIIVIRGQRVIADSQLASLYGTSTKRLNEQVKRNLARFPADFMFRVTEEEMPTANWSQIATSSQRHRRHKFAPFVFTEHGAIMAATVLNTPKARLISHERALSEILAVIRQLTEGSHTKKRRGIGFTANTAE